MNQSQGSGNVQSTFQGGNGNAWVITRDGRTVDTGVAMQKFSPQMVGVGGGMEWANPNTRTTTTGGSIASPQQQISAAAAKAGAEQAAVETAKTDAIPARSAAEFEADRRKMQQQNTAAFNAFSAAMQGLERSMAQTQTGPISGRLPAVTAAAQTAEGAVAATAPILKQLFRSAGEGTFTDRDQQLLLDMVPTRKDHPEARAAKIQMINQIVAAKLGIQSPTQAGVAPPAQGGSTSQSGSTISNW
jgi:hypothetical protein